MDIPNSLQPSPNDIIIVIMGVTGSGKSTFVKLATGDEDVQVGHDLESCQFKTGLLAYFYLS